MSYKSSEAPCKDLEASTEAILDVSVKKKKLKEHKSYAVEKSI